MIVDLAGVTLHRPPHGLDFSDLTTAKVTGSPRWVDATTLEIPFDHEPTEAEQAAIRRRMVTKDAAEEARVAQYRDLADSLAADSSPLGRAVRLLLAERLDAVREVPDASTKAAKRQNPTKKG